MIIALALIILGSKIAGSLIKSTLAASSGNGFTVMADTAKKNNAAEYGAIGTIARGKLSLDDVTGLFNQRGPKLTGEKDTFAGKDPKGNRVVAYYSLNPELQGLLHDIFKQYKPRYGAVVVMDPQSGRVLALASYHNETAPDRGSDLFLRALFPAASVFKTVTATAAIEKARYSAQTLIQVTGQSHTLYKFQLKKVLPTHDEVTFEEAYAKSMNPVFGRIGMHVLGKTVLEDYSRRFGFNTAVPFEMKADTSRVSVPEDTTYAMAEFASGFNRHTSLSPLHGALIASAVAEQGVMPLPHFVDSICRVGDGECLYKSNPAPWKTCMTKATSDELDAMMNAVVLKGTARKSFRCLKSCNWSSELECGGKTGSIEADSLGKIDWFIGFARRRNEQGPGLAIAVVTTHGSFWTVHSSYIASEVFRKYFRPEFKSIAAHPALSAVQAKTRG
jgi:cell division protein FtsI/penicillin-binding protein 2